MSYSLRRAFLEGAGLALAGGLGGCVSRLSSSRGTTPTDWPRRTSGTDDPVQWSITHEYGALQRPAVANGTVFVGWTSSGDSRLGAVTALAEGDGSIQWHAGLSRPPAGPPTTDGNNLYLVSGLDNGLVGSDQRLHRFTTRGAEKWQTEPVDGFLHLLAFGDGRAYLGTSHDNPQPFGAPMYAASLVDGTWAWTADPGDSTKGVYREGRLLADFTARGFGAYDPVDGDERWRVDSDPFLDARCQFVTANGTAFTQARDGVTVVDLEDGSAGWKFVPEGTKFTPTGVAASDRALVVTEYEGHVFGVDPDSGTERWRVRTGGDANRPPLVVGGSAYVGDSDGNVYALDAVSGDERWRARTAGSVLDFDRNSEVLVTVSSQEGGREVAAFDVVDGTTRWRYETAADLRGPVFGENHVFVTERSGSLIALGD